jgi:hypothetical protein
MQKLSGQLIPPRCDYYDNVTVRSMQGCYSQISVVDVLTLQRGHPWPPRIPVDTSAHIMTMGRMNLYVLSAIERSAS